ncbi:MAG: hypothetical protein HGB19_05560 [Chlorobiales bacterium]|nr:hypothetical protein [Chlorobiales bacterium]
MGQKFLVVSKRLLGIQPTTNRREMREFRKCGYGGVWRFLVPIIIVLMLGACSGERDAKIKKADRRFQEGLMFSEGFDYRNALDAFQEAAKLDTMLSRNEEALRDFLQLEDVQERAGLLNDALLSLAAADSLTPPDSETVKRKIVDRQVEILTELGEWKDAVARQRSLKNLLPNEALRLARLYMKTGETVSAYQFYRKAAASESAVVRIEAYAGLAMFLDENPSGKQDYDSSRTYQKKIVELCKAAEKSSLSDDEKFDILTTGARALSAFEPELKNASFLMFKALGLLGKDRQAEMLWWHVAFEANSYAVRRVANLEESLNYFKQQDYRIGMAHAYALLGMEGNYGAEQQISYLKNGLEICEEFFIYDLPRNTTRDLEAGFYKLVDVLLKQARYQEAYEVSERIKMLHQRNLILKNGFATKDAGLQAEILSLRKLYAEIAALQVRKDMAAFLPEKDKEIRRNMISRRLAESQGDFYTRLAAIKAKNPNYAELFQPRPVTLPTLQSILPERTAVADAFISDETATVIFITKDKVKVFQNSISKEVFQNALEIVQWDFLEAKNPDKQMLMESKERALLTTIFASAIELELEGIDRLICVSRLKIPFHILGSAKFLQEQVALSYLTSAKQLELARNVTPDGTLEFTNLNNIGYIPEACFADRRESVLLWRDFSAQELADQRPILDLALKSKSTLAEALKQIAIGKTSEGDCSWIGLSAYGY